MTVAVRDIELAPDVASADFKAAMRGLAGGVSIVTVGNGRDISGMTVTSVVSLAIDPPTLLVSLNRNASSWPLLRRYGAFAVNVVGADQQDVAERFSGIHGHKGADRFDDAEWIVGATGVPLLRGALASFDCTIDEIIPRHSHGIVIGRVRGVLTSPGKAALAYWDGQYATLDSAADLQRLADVSVPNAARR